MKKMLVFVLVATLLMLVGCSNGVISVESGISYENYESDAKKQEMMQLKYDAAGCLFANETRDFKGESIYLLLQTEISPLIFKYTAADFGITDASKIKEIKDLGVSEWKYDPYELGEDFEINREIQIILNESDESYLYPELRDKVVKCKASFVDFYNKIIERCGDIKTAVIDIFTKNILILKAKFIILLIGVASSFKDLYQNLMRSLLSFVFKKLKLQGGAEEEVKIVESKMDKFKNKLRSLGKKFNIIGEKTKVIVLNYIDKHSNDFNNFYKSTIWPSIQQFSKDIMKKCDIAMLIKDLNGLNVNTFIPYVHYFITKIQLAINVLFDPEVLKALPTKYTSMDELMDVKKEEGGSIIYPEYLRKPITEDNYGLKLEKYFQDIVLKGFLKELSDDVMKLTTVFTDPNRLMTLFAGLIPEIKLSYDLENIPTNIKLKLGLQ